MCPSSQTQMGSGVPQYRSRDRPQSTTFSRKLPMRPSLMLSGIQLTVRLFFTSSSRTAVMRMNHVARA